jgi:RecA/RadA recombinase
VLIQSAHDAMHPRSHSLRKRTAQKLSLGDPLLDNFFRGGLLTRSLTEFYGEAGCGKTQLALQLCLTVQLPPEFGGLNGGKNLPPKKKTKTPVDALYLTSEPPFPTARFFHLLEHRFPNLIGPWDIREQQELIYEQGYDHVVKDAGSRVHIVTLTDVETQSIFINHQLSEWLTTEEYNNVKLVVLDSVAANFRSENGKGVLSAMASRGRQLYDLGKSLKQVADEFNVVVVCMNQVTERMDDYGKVASLGGSWSHTVNTRVQLKKFRGEGDGDSRRVMLLDFATHLPKGEVAYEIAGNGIRGL